MPRCLDLDEDESDMNGSESMLSEEERKTYRENSFWRQAFCAALAGVAACPSYHDVGMLKSPIPAARMADLAIEEAKKRGRI